MLCKLEIKKAKEMSQVELNTPAPDFTLDDYNGNTVSLSDYKGKKQIILALNRGFV